MSRTELYKQFDNSMKHGAEIGVGNGANAVDILTSFPFMHLLLVDPWSGNPKRSARYYRMLERKVRGNLEPYLGRVTTAKMRSDEAAPRVPDRSLDFVYIDGDHNYDAVALDIFLWHNKVRPGGILAGHDYVATRRHGVKKAVDDYASRCGIELHTFMGNWWWEVQ